MISLLSAGDAPAISDDGGHQFELLQLPQAALDLVLQKLDPCSLASTCVSCSKLRYCFPANLSHAMMTFTTPEKLQSFIMWLAQHSSKLTSLDLCGSGQGTLNLDYLPCSKLLQLRLKGLDVKFGQVDGHPGVLQDCTGLTALDLQGCRTHSGLAAVAVLPELRHLRSLPSLNMDEIPTFTAPLKLTHLSMSAYFSTAPQPSAYFSTAPQPNLSTLVNLRHLDLSIETPGGVPGGLPSQLMKLTCLRVSYLDVPIEVAGQFQHLSSLTALQELAVTCPAAAYDGSISIPGIQHLEHLTSLALQLGNSTRFAFEFSTAIIDSWACRTALQSLALTNSDVHPDALAALTQLRSLSLTHVTNTSGASPEGLLHAVSKLTLLTNLCWFYGGRRGGYKMLPDSAAASFTALTASSSLQSLTFVWSRLVVPQSHVLFRIGNVHPHLRWINLFNGSPQQTVNEEQLALLCSCCPAVESLAFVLHRGSSCAACLPLLRLSTLTQLYVWVMGPGYYCPAWAGRAAAAVDVAAQLTGLKDLEIGGICEASHNTLMQLTTLRGLVRLSLPSVSICLLNKARAWNPPDVSTQLHDLLIDRLAQRLAATSIQP